MLSTTSRNSSRPTLLILSRWANSSTMDSSRSNTEQFQKPRQRRASAAAAFLRNEVHDSSTGFVDIKVEDGSLAIIKRKGSVEKTTTEASDFPAVQEPGSVRLFLCPSQDCIEQLEDYLEFGEEAKDVEYDKNRMGLRSMAEGGLPYDLSEIVSWLLPKRLEVHDSTQNQVDPQAQPTAQTSRTWKPMLLAEPYASFTFTELFARDKRKGKEEYTKSIQHRLYLFNDPSEQKSTIVWNCCNSKYTRDISPCQRTFMDNLLNGQAFKNTNHDIQISLATFPTLFLLEVLAIDIYIFSSAVKSEVDPNPVTDLTDTRNAIMTSPFAAMESRIYSFNRIKAMVEKAEDLSSCFRYLSKSLSPTLEDADLRALTLKTENLVKHTKRIDARYTDLFALNTTVSQSRQSFYVTILTVLAAVFLPLSLASAVLSMQYRFSELGTRLYDFFGVAWLFLTFALLCGVAVRFGNHVNDKLWRLRHLDRNSYGTYKNIVKGITYSYIVAWTLLLISFLLGMFLSKDKVDWRSYPLLGIGVAIFVLAPIVVPVLDVIFMVLGAFVNCGDFWRMLRPRGRTDRAEMAV
ncbi:hypothetical protein BDV96DRAFT_594747 [Lophiotrema nucula]|uniref:Cora-like Mg2+ transporter protein-domain-containing protein n=1 Tax=Lophiotrema nucula TaxID=690887 RepID=A0A6A5ZTC8_9PLEO|nr:hypothetical protein BDV96DRAFT_594747 [Lophiotrema nucula]